MTRGKCFLWLVLAIAAEISATFMLILSNGLTRALPAVFATLGYMISYYSLTWALQRIPMGIAYAMWSGIGILATNIIGVYYFGETLRTGGLIGMWLIIIGVLIINLLGSTDAQGEKA